MDVRLLNSWLKQAETAQAAMAVRESHRRFAADARSVSGDAVRCAHIAAEVRSVRSWGFDALANVEAIKASRACQGQGLREADSNHEFAYRLNEVAAETANLRSDQVSRVVRVLKTWQDWNRAASVVTPAVGTSSVPALNTYLAEFAPRHPAVSTPNGRTRRWFKRWRSLVLQVLELGVGAHEVADTVATVAPPTRGSNPAGVPRRARPLPNWLHALLENTIEPGAPFVARLRKTSIGEPALV